MVELERLTSSRGPDQQLQRRQRVYRQLGVQQALVLVQFKQMNNLFKFGNVVVLLLSVEKYLFSTLLVINQLLVLTNHGF